MKKLFYACAAIMVLTFSACEDHKKQESDLFDSILKMHDKVMADDETVIKNKTLLDSLLKSKRIPQSNDQVFQTVQNLDHADEAMENWMHQFNADYNGKPHDEIMQYLNDQKQKLIKVDAQLGTAIKQSNTYISSLKK